jgi:CelD/BcsL family acetyltransferase involved in cellulose biosynthesis
VLDVEIIAALPAGGFVEAWRNLAVRAENPFSSPEWTASYLEGSRDTRALILACRSSGDELVGVVPLTMDARGRLSPAAASHADWFGPACAPEHQSDVAFAAMTALDRSGHLKRSWIMPRCVTGAGWLSGVRRARRLNYELVPTDVEVQISLARFSQPAAMSGKHRREIARLLRRLEEAHAVEFRCARTVPEAEQDFPVFERLHMQRWPLLRTPSEARFQRAFALRAADQGWLRLWTLVIDGQPAAALYGWRLGARTFAYMQAFDSAWSRLGVGILLLDHAVRAAEAEDCEVFDMLRGRESHKTRFENDRLTVRTFVVVRKRSLARLALQGRASARTVFHRLPERHQAPVRKALRRT